MKLLSIGNSFSQDAHRWLHALAKLNGIDLYTANLYIGGCSLERHWQNVVENNADYQLEINGDKGERTISIADALNMEAWDVVTVQQVSRLSGIPASYEPYISNLVKVVRTAAPQAKLYFHQTWAYEVDFTRDSFLNYHNDQKEMYDRIIETTQAVATSIHAQIIPVGRILQRLRETVAAFDYKNGGLSLCRDGFHLSLDYGRFAAAAVWLRTLTGVEVKAPAFEDFDPSLLRDILQVVN